MTESIEKEIKRAIAASEGNYYRLILLVGESGSGKTKTLNDVGKALGVSVLNLNLLLSKQLLEVTPKQRPLQLPKIFKKVIKEADEMVILDNIEILFDTSLKQDPLRLLQKASRNKTIVSSWGGKQDHSKLLYAKAGHSEYKAYDITDLLTVGMDGPTDFNPITQPGEVDKV